MLNYQVILQNNQVISEITRLFQKLPGITYVFRPRDANYLWILIPGNYQVITRLFVNYQVIFTYLGNYQVILQVGGYFHNRIC